jgi:hypothetical protein
LQYVLGPIVLWPRPTPPRTLLPADAPALLQLAKRYEAAVRVCQYNSGPQAARRRNVGDILEREHELQQQIAKGTAPA